MATIETRTAVDGTPSYRVRIRLRGEQPRTRTFKRLTDAKAWAAKAESDLGHGMYVPQTADRRRTLALLIDTYLTEFLPFKANNRDADGQAAQLAWWREHFGHATLDKLNAALLASARPLLAQRTNRHGKTLSGATINRYFAAISAVCKWAWKEKHWLPHNPVLDISKAAENKGIVRFLSDAERAALFEACRQHPDRNAGLIVMLALATGARYSNLRKLRWEDVDFERWTLAVERTKNGEARYVPIVGAAQAAMQAHYDADPTGESWIFKGQRDTAPADVEKKWREVRDAAGIKNFRFHDLRHTTGSYLTQRGAGLAQVADALGHKTLATAKRYAHQNSEHVRNTLAAIADTLDD